MSASPRTDSRLRFGALIGAAWLSDEPHPLLGVNVSHLSRYAHYNLQVSGGTRADSPRVVSVAAGHYFPSLADSELSFRSDWWYGEGHQSSLSLMWEDLYGTRRLSLTHASGDRLLHPWSGEPSVPQGWHLEHGRQIVLNDSHALESRLFLHAQAGSPPTWLVTSGSRWRQTGFISAHAEAGLLLRAGSYRPLIRVGATVTTISHGDIEVTLSPLLADLPEGWPAIRLDYRGSGPSPPRSLLLQWIHQENRLIPQLMFRFTPPATPHAINIVWSPHSRAQGLITFERAF